MTQLTGKTALITGSTLGIGLGLAKGFAAAGANVVLNGFDDAAEIEQIRSTLDGIVKLLAPATIEGNSLLLRRL